MDENTAWKNFVQTGRVSDYLAYCRIKLGYPAENTAEDTEDGKQNPYRRTDTDELGRW